MRKSIFREGLLDSYLQHAVFVAFGLYRQCFFLQRKDVSLYVCIFFLFFYTEDSIPYTLFQTLLFHWIIFPGEHYTFLIIWGIPESKSLHITYFCHYFLGKSWTCFCSTKNLDSIYQFAKIVSLCFKIYILPKTLSAFHQIRSSYV